MRLDTRFNPPVKRPKRQEISNEMLEENETALTRLSNRDIRNAYYHTRNIKPGRK